MKFKKKAALSSSNPNFISISEWIKHAPYTIPLNGYDTQFLPLCNQVLKILNGYGFLQDGKTSLNLAKRKELAIVLVAYFEDFINDIGIWKAFVTTNKELYGFALPLLDLSEYEEDYLNKEDLAYIIFHFIHKHNEPCLFSPNGAVLDVAKEIFDYLEPMIDNIEPTAYYDRYLAVKSTDNYFDFKDKYVWFGTQSYLMGVESKIGLAKKEEEIIDSVTKTPAMLPYFEQLLYQELDNHIFSHRSSFSALNTFDWLALIIKSDEATKNQVKNLTYRHSGAFIYSKIKDKDFFVYTNIITNREYLVYRLSVNGDNKTVEPNTTTFEMNLIFWDKKWWQTGVAMGFDKKGYTKPMTKPHLVPWIFSQEEQDKRRAASDKMYNSHVAFFGSPLYVSKDIEDLATQLINSNHFYNTGEMQNTGKEVALQIENQKKSFEKQFGKNEKGVSLFFVKGFGQVFDKEIDTIIQLMELENTTQDESDDLFYRLVYTIYPELAAYLIETYPTHNIKAPFIPTVEKTLASMPFLYRLLTPERFGPQTPMIVYAK